MLLGAPEFADPKEYLRSPRQSESERVRVAAALSILDGPAHAIRSLGRIALQPQVTCQTNTDQDVMFQAEPDLACMLEGPVAKRSLKLHARSVMVAHKLECAA